jgi:2-oxoglutarate dehydrogenase E2 component (dihydrolipoamide succinyltransferase)
LQKGVLSPPPSLKFSHETSRLKSAQNVAAMLTTFQEVDMGPLMDMRNKHKEEFEKKHGVKLGFMSAFVKVTFFKPPLLPAEHFL